MNIGVIENIKKILASYFDEHTLEIVNGAGATFVLKGLGAILQFLVSLLLARKLGTDGAGVYFLAISIGTAIWMFGCFGLENSLLKFVAAHSSKGEWNIVIGVYRKSLLVCTIFSIMLSLVLLICAPFLVESVFCKAPLLGPIRYVALSVWPMCMIWLNGEALKGLKRIKLSQSINGVFIPLGMLLMVLIAGENISATRVAQLYLLVSILTASCGYIIWKKSIPKAKLDRYIFPTKVLLDCCVPLVISTVSYQIMAWTATILLGVWGTESEIGIFSVAVRTANLVSFILISVNSILAPKFADFFWRGDHESLEETAQKATTIMTLIASPLLLICFIFPDWFMSIFGPKFSEGGNILIILAIGQFVNVITGSVGYLLMMCGQQKVMRNNSTIAAILTVIISCIIIPQYGISGAAFTTTFSMVWVNFWACILVKRHLNIWTFPLAPKAKKTQS